jgi:hypothetical protein
MTRKKRPWLALASPVLLLGPIGAAVATAAPASARTTSETLTGETPRTQAGVLYGVGVFNCADKGWVEGEASDKFVVRMHNQSPDTVQVSVSVKDVESFRNDEGVQHVALSAGLSVGSKGAKGGAPYKVTVYCTMNRDARGWHQKPNPPDRFNP